MGYLHISNLSKDQRILMFKECYALEKIHGTSAHISFKLEYIEPTPLEIMQEKESVAGICKISFFAGGENHTNFVKLFDEPKLREIFIDSLFSDITFYGEAYGGKQQGMSDTYGKELKFVVFDVKMGEKWLDVPKAEEFTNLFGLEFVAYNKIETYIVDIDYQRDLDSDQALRNGCGVKMREGVVLKPLIEFATNNGERIICKHKRPEFSERKSKKDTNITQDKVEILKEVNAIVDEWVTEMRLKHILGKLESYDITKTKEIIELMKEDVLREAQGEILIVRDNKDLMSAIGKRTAQLFKQHLNSKIGS